MRYLGVEVLPWSYGEALRATIEVDGPGPLVTALAQHLGIEGW